MDDPDDLTLLDRAEEVRLARAIEAGLLARAQRESGLGRVAATTDELRALEHLGRTAQRRMVAANLGLVGVVVGRTTCTAEVSPLDLFQDGCVGLIDAVRRFDHARGLKFSTYALIRIRAAVDRSAYRAQASGRLTPTRLREQRRLRWAEGELTQRFGRSARADEVAAELGREVGWVSDLLADDAAVPIEAVVDLVESVVHGDVDGAGDELGERTTPLERYGAGLLERLAPVHRRVLELRYGFGPDGRSHSLREIAALLGSTLGVVRRLEREGLDELRARCSVEARALF